MCAAIYLSLYLVIFVVLEQFGKTKKSHRQHCCIRWFLYFVGNNAEESKIDMIMDGKLYKQNREKNGKMAFSNESFDYLPIAVDFLNTVCTFLHIQLRFTIGFGLKARNTINTILSQKFEHKNKRILEMSFRGSRGSEGRCHFMFFTIVLRRPTIWQVYERKNSIALPSTGLQPFLLSLSLNAFFQKLFLLFTPLLCKSVKRRVELLIRCYLSSSKWSLAFEWEHSRSCYLFK